MSELHELLRRRQASLRDELVRQAGPVAVLAVLLRNLERPWPSSFDPKDFKEAVFPWLTQLHQSFDDARSVRDGWTNTIAAITRESEALKTKLSGGELENPDYDRDRERYHVKRIETECYQEALVRLETELTATEREWERVKPITEAEIEKYADKLFERERYILQGEIEEWQVKQATVRTDAAELSRWHSRLRERYGLTITPRKVIFNPPLPAAHSYSIEIEKEQVSHA